MPKTKPTRGPPRSTAVKLAIFVSSKIRMTYGSAPLTVYATDYRRLIITVIAFHLTVSSQGHANATMASPTHVPRPPKDRHHAHLHERELHTCVREAETTTPSPPTVRRTSPCHLIPKANLSTIPAAFEAGRGVIIRVIANTPGPRTLGSMVTGPSIVLQQSGSLTALTAQ
jgi:hypothetical protein